jgi:predicted MFS family arabinose efflux permease
MAGTFGGPATSLSLAIVADVVPPERRGKALGIVMSAFAVSSVFGVPASLALASLGSWNTPFFVVAGLGAVVAASALFLMPSLRLHLAAGSQRAPDRGLGEMLGRPEVLFALAAMACFMISIFALVPNLAAYVLNNLGYPREHLDLLYMAGGLASFLVIRLIGTLVDRFGATVVATIGSAFMIVTLVVGFAAPVPGIPVMALYVAYMVSNSFRSVPLSALSSRVPASHERARFMSVQSAVQHMSAAFGSVAGAQMLSELPDKRLDGIPQVALLTIAFSLALPLCLWSVEQRVRRRERERATGAAAPAPVPPHPEPPRPEPA